MKKGFVFLVCFCAVGARAASDFLTSPFYAPGKDISATETSLAFSERKTVGRIADFKTRFQTAAQRYLYGLSDKAAIDLNLQNSWTRQKGTFNEREDTNFAGHAGAVYSFYRRDALFQTQILYRQRETHHAHGAYKAFYTKLQTGYDFGTVLPYLGGSIEIPVAQSKHADDKLLYSAYAGFYGVLKEALSLHTAFVFDYNDNTVARQYRNDSELSYLITPKIAFSAFGSYVFSDKEQNKTKVHERKLGIRFRAAF